MQEEDNEDEIESPCVGVCRLDPQQLCIGCQRSMDEISEWPYAAAARKREILKLAQLRLAGLETKSRGWFRRN